MMRGSSLLKELIDIILDLVIVSPIGNRALAGSRTGSHSPKIVPLDLKPFGKPQNAVGFLDFYFGFRIS
jgi:hypothetical protein